MVEWYRSLLAVRRCHPDLGDPTVRATATHRDGVLTVERGRVRVHANLGPQPCRIAVAPGARLLLASVDAVTAEGSEARLPVDSVVLLTLPIDPDD